MKTNTSRILATLLAGTVLAGCASPNYPLSASSSSYPYPASPAPSPSPYPYPAQTTTQPGYGYQYGTVDSIQMVQGAAAAANGGIGVGTVVGGVVGGLLGNQVGGGSGRKAATVAGVIGGAVVGNQMEQRNNQARNAYQVGVRLDNGAYRTIVQDNVADLYVGGRVRIENDRAYRQ
ncbi:outer membrane lipoprotein [Noviherbaspirillum aerium]|uniref:glycine zipper 2TM domain-containing protein n=1 Tax=Noviherbaspirillum aerium TaxID=2588497 RepID=UPI00124EA9E1|nr:glycine zipper 2TM domain-containing protein [Noviherbaspirillum aerium]